MKPTKNKIYCRDCGRKKMLFETEKKAENFIKFNTEEIVAESGYSPQRSYYCLFCGGWHTTSIKEKFGLSKNEQRFEQYTEEKEKTEALKIGNLKNTAIKKSRKDDNQEKRNKKINDLESQIKEMEPSQKENFFSENISLLKKEIELLLTSNSSTDKENLKDIRVNLEIMYRARKQNGFQNNEKINKIIEEENAKEIEEWRLWAKKNGY